MAAKPTVAIRWQGRPEKGLSAYLRGLALEVLKRVGVEQGELVVFLCDDRTMQRLNSYFRQKEQPTDVLSFPAHELLPEGGVHLGDIAISLETAARQAAQADHSLERELGVLLIHGILHVCGFDHETDNGEMEAREAELREALL